MRDLLSFVRVQVPSRSRPGGCNPMKKRRRIACLAFIMAMSLSPAFAGFVYVPVLDRTGPGGSTHATEVWLSNSGTQERRYGTLFLPAGTDGTQRPAPSTKASLLPLRTNKLVGLGSPG